MSNKYSWMKASSSLLLSNEDKELLINSWDVHHHSLMLRDMHGHTIRGSDSLQRHSIDWATEGNNNIAYDWMGVIE